MIGGRAMIMPRYEDGPTMHAYMSLGGIFGEGHHDLSLDVGTYMGQARIVGQADVIWGGDVVGRDIGGCELDWESVGSFDEEQAKTVLRLLPHFVAKFEEAARRGECASDREAEEEIDV